MLFNAFLMLFQCIQFLFQYFSICFNGFSILFSALSMLSNACSMFCVMLFYGLPLLCNACRCFSIFFRCRFIAFQCFFDVVRRLVNAFSRLLIVTKSCLVRLPFKLRHFVVIEPTGNVVVLTLASNADGVCTALNSMQTPITDVY